MSSNVYVQPTGLVYGTDASSGIAEGWAGSLACARIGYTTCKILEGTPGCTAGRVLSYREFAAISDGSLRTIRERIEAPRMLPEWCASAGPTIMGVINVTPDSFSDGGLFADHEAAIQQGRALHAAGAHVLDVGGESTRPGSDAISADEECRRILPVIEALNDPTTVLSVDTRKADVMTAAVQAGASVINDVSALSFDDDSLEVAAKLKLPVILMHALGDPKTMQDDPQYDDVLLEVYDYLEERVEACEAAGIAREMIMVDPGIGFGKTGDHNLVLIHGATIYHGLGVRVLYGVSRKRFIGTISGQSDAAKRVSGSISAALAAIARGVQTVRVHDVAETLQATSVWHAIHG